MTFWSIYKNTDSHQFLWLRFLKLQHFIQDVQQNYHYFEMALLDEVRLFSYVPKNPITKNILLSLTQTKWWVD